MSCYSYLIIHPLYYSVISTPGCYLLFSDWISHFCFLISVIWLQAHWMYFPFKDFCTIKILRLDCEFEEKVKDEIWMQFWKTCINVYAVINSKAQSCIIKALEWNYSPNWNLTCNLEGKINYECITGKSTTTFLYHCIKCYSNSNLLTLFIDIIKVAD